MSEFQFGVSNLNLGTQGVKSHYHEPDMSLRLFVSKNITEKGGKSKGCFRLTEGARQLLNMKDGDFIAVANMPDTPKSTFFLANVTGQTMPNKKGEIIEAKDFADGKVSGKGTFYSLKLVEALQKLGCLPADLGATEVVLDVRKAFDTPPMIACRLEEVSSKVISPSTSQDEVLPDSDIAVLEDHVPDAEFEEYQEEFEEQDQPGDEFPVGEQLL